MIKNLQLFLSFTILLLFTSNATAGAYIGGGFGKVDYDADSISTFDDPIGIELFAGTDVSNNFAFEVSILDFGESSDGQPPEWHIDASSIAFGGLLKAPISSTAEFFIKVGFHMWDYEFTEDFNPIKLEDDGTDLFFGFGAAFNVNPNVKFGLRYMNYTVDTYFQEFDVTMFLFNAAYLF